MHKQLSIKSATAKRSGPAITINVVLYSGERQLITDVTAIDLSLTDDGEILVVATLKDGSTLALI